MFVFRISLNEEPPLVAGAAGADDLGVLKAAVIARRLWARKLTTALALGLAASVMQGCALYEAFGGMPYAEATVTLASRPGTAQVLDCVRSSVVTLKPEPPTGWWSTQITRFDPAHGVVETGRYPESNVAGVRLRATYDEPAAQLRLQIKAGGPYYVDLGAQSHLDQLRARVVACVQG